MNRRAIVILGAIFLLIVGTLGFLLYQRQHNNKVAEETQQNATPAPQQPEPPANEEPEQTPPPGPEAKAVKLSDDEVLSPVLFFQGNGVTYLNSRGQLFQTKLNISAGNAVLSDKTEITIPLKSGLTRVLWPQTGNRFIAEYGSGTSRFWSFYDGDKGTFTDLPAGIISLDWLGAEKIMFVYVDKVGKATLNVANPDGSGYQTITDMYEVDDEIEVAPDVKKVIFWRTQNREAANTLHWLSADGKDYKALVEEGYNLGVKWNRDSTKFVFGRRNPQTQVYQLWLADAATGQTKNLGVNTTPDKVVWTNSGNYLFAAVPKTPSTNSLSEDTIMEINAVSADKQEFDPGISVDAEDLFLDSTQNILFFKNQQDRALYYIDVSK